MPVRIKITLYCSLSDQGNEKVSRKQETYESLRNLFKKIRYLIQVLITCYFFFTESRRNLCKIPLLT
jgi:hypothetical protein